MRRRILVLLVLAPLALLSMGARPAKPMYEPQPMGVPDGMKVDEVVAVVVKALEGRGWTVDKKAVAEDGSSARIDTTLNVRVHMVKITIDVDLESIQIAYVDSKEMRYKVKKDVRYIHPKYAQWIQNVEADVRAGLSGAKQP